MDKKKKINHPKSGKIFFFFTNKILQEKKLNLPIPIDN